MITGLEAASAILFWLAAISFFTLFIAGASLSHPWVERKVKSWRRRYIKWRMGE